MSKVFVQYRDSKEAEIIAVFSCSQDAARYPNQGEVETESDIYQQYIASVHSLIPVAALSMPS